MKIVIVGFGLHIQKCRQLQHHQENQGNLKLLGLNINKMVRDISSRSWIFKNEWIGYKKCQGCKLSLNISDSMVIF